MALQLYTVRDEAAKDFAGTMRRVAQAGYTAVELAGYGGLDAPDLRALLDETGLRAASTHVGLALLEENLDAQIDYALAIGCSHLVVPSVPVEMRSAASFRAVAPRFNEFAKAARQRGLGFAYHNHNFEFVTEEGAYLLDTLLDASDPDLVKLELDIYWAAFAGVDPVEYLRRRADRISLIHLKDLAADHSYTEVGAGTLDFGAIFSAAEAAGVEWGIVELDKPRIPSLESARLSLEYLRAMGKA